MLDVGEVCGTEKGKCCRNRAPTILLEMRTPIKDEFQHLPISRQRKYQLRMRRDGRCTECGRPAHEASRCLKHLVMARERQRKKNGLKARYYGTMSYLLESWAATQKEHS